MMKTIVIGLGGNALLSPSGRQGIGLEMRNAEKVSIQIAKLAATRNYKIILTHGNGPQVGDELLRNAAAERSVARLPFYIISSETEAQIGTVLELALRNSLAKIRTDVGVGVVLTHVLVDEKDRAFSNPTKPIGPFRKSPGRDGAYKKFRKGYRLVVPSPAPKRILESDAISLLSKDNIVIACGGGGVPVSRIGKSYKGINGVIDKDATTRLLATSVEADEMVLLTDVDCVYSDYNSRSGMIASVKADVLARNIDKFEEGTMRPKVAACVDFVRHGGKTAYIGNLHSLDSILEGRSGTKVS